MPSCGSPASSAARGHERVIVRLLLVIACLAALLWLLHWFRSTPPERVSRTLRKSALWAVAALLVVAALTGRLNPLFAAVGAAIPLVVRAANLLRMLPALQQALRALGLGSLVGSAHAGDGGQVSRIRTRYLDMRLDPLRGVS